MAWFNKKEDELPEALRGKTPEQVAEMFKAAGDAVEAAKVNAKKAEDLEAALKTTKTEFEQTKERLSAIEANQSRGGGEEKKIDVPSVLTDEDAAFATRQQPLVTGLLVNAARTARIVAEQQALRDPMLSYTIKKYGSDIEKYYNSIPLGSRGSEIAYTNCVKLVMAEHMNEIINESKKENNEIFSESPSSNRGNEPGKKDDGKLSPMEESVAKKMKMTPEEYLKAKKQLNLVEA